MDTFVANQRAEEYIGYILTCAERIERLTKPNGTLEKTTAILDGDVSYVETLHNLAKDLHAMAEDADYGIRGPHTASQHDESAEEPNTDDLSRLQELAGLK